MCCKYCSACGQETDVQQDCQKAIEKLTAEEQQEIRAYCENNERQAFDVGFKTAVQLWNQLDNTGGIME